MRESLDPGCRAAQGHKLLSRFQMEVALSKKSILKKTAQVASSTMMSKFLAIIRTYYEVRYFGAGAISDAYFTAYRLPNFLRKVFAEGGLAPVVVPNLIQSIQTKGTLQASKLMTLILLFVEVIIFSICMLVLVFAEKLILLTAPGFASKPLELATAVPLVRVLIFFVLFVSSSACLQLQCKQKIISLSPHGVRSCLIVFI